ncbi:hypothetical protein ACFXJ6_02980 [Streptomyces sp. NPDC059218]|uniref:hypothetical protein n=1 Tax=unclassified Streptomyces TaxID=2593676 RepID=UPI003677C541
MKALEPGHGLGGPEGSEARLSILGGEIAAENGEAGSMVLSLRPSWPANRPLVFLELRALAASARASKLPGGVMPARGSTLSRKQSIMTSSSVLTPSSLPSTVTISRASG